MRLRRLAVALTLLAGLGVGVPAHSGVIVSGPLPTNAYITYNGFDWAWANPWPHSDPSSLWDLSVQAGYGWRIPTPAELTGAPTAAQFMFAGANVPLGGIDPVSTARFQATNANLSQDAACASPYFSLRNWCDWQDGRGESLGWDWYGSAANTQPGLPYDTLAIRNAAVPEPTMVLLLGLGLAGLGVVKRRLR